MGFDRAIYGFCMGFFRWLRFGAFAFWVSLKALVISGLWDLSWSWGASGREVGAVSVVGLP